MAQQTKKVKWLPSCGRTVGGEWQCDHCGDCESWGDALSTEEVDPGREWEEDFSLPSDAESMDLAYGPATPFIL